MLNTAMIDKSNPPGFGSSVVRREVSWKTLSRVVSLDHLLLPTSEVWGQGVREV